VYEHHYTEGEQNIEYFDNFSISCPSRIFWAAVYITIYAQFATAWWLWLLIPVHFLMSPIHGAIINWFAHKYGYRNFEVGDTSMNFLPVDFLMMGESYHNNHHKHGGRANFGGIRWHEIDPTYLVIKVLDKLNIIQIARRKEVSLENVKKAA
jgi:stearoyl-CoA desaturase (delta-9 desaturase)